MAKALGRVVLGARIAESKEAEQRSRSRGDEVQTSDLQLDRGDGVRELVRQVACTRGISACILASMG